VCQVERRQRDATERNLADVGYTGSQPMMEPVGTHFDSAADSNSPQRTDLLSTESREPLRLP
jgi:hypothetical protein